MKSFQTDSAGIFQYEQETTTAPFGAVFASPPDVPEGQAAKWVTELERVSLDYGQEGTGQWQMIDDHRKAELYLTSDGQQYTIGTEVNGDKYDGLGEIPSWLTTQASPGQFYEWQDGSWVLNEQAKREANEASERAWRDHQIASVEWLRNRHRDELEQQLEPTLTEAQYVELQTYIQALRDWPADEAFPDSEGRPLKPVWVGQ